ncbi:ergothioneine biosynthesis protein EgtC [Nocardioides lentus]|uniref:Gamma-glutamyl-hercynylcysteine sulfoxide hydrolase n=1 Tax=Nocardioides lentus TaxID=338077 RepID=A0ABN2P3W9_9ACTN
MCRHLAWLGERRSVASLVLDPPHGLLTQSYAPRRQSHGLMNADGWGVGLHHPDAEDGAPVRWRSARPLWGEASFASVAPVLRSRSVVAAVRSATPGMPPDETAAAPFTDGRWLLSHNGRVDRDVLPASAAAAAESRCDSAVLAAHVLARGVDRLTDTVAEVAAADPDARLSLLLGDSERVLAVTWGDPASYLATEDGVAVASEPWDDDPRWVDVPDRHLLVATRDTVTVTAL